MPQLVHMRDLASQKLSNPNQGWGQKWVRKCPRKRSSKIGGSAVQLDFVLDVMMLAGPLSDTQDASFPHTSCQLLQTTLAGFRPTSPYEPSSKFLARVVYLIPGFIANQCLADGIRFRSPCFKQSQILQLGLSKPSHHMSSAGLFWPLLPYCFQRVPLDFNEALWTSMGPYCLQWGLVDFNEALWTSMGPFWFQWGPMDFNEARWTSMKPC